MAKLQNVLRAFYGSEWAILPEKLAEIEALLHLKAEGSELREELRARYASMSRPQDGTVGQIAVLNMFGTISQRMNALSEFSGGTSTELFMKAFREARDNPAVTAILINADTPGGSVPGVPEASDEIYAARGIKPIKTLVNPMMASAGVWIGSAADEIIAIPSASDIGSIGVLIMHTDTSAADAESGIKRTIIQSTPYKAEGNPHQPLSEETLAHYQSRVLAIHAEFVEAVARNRGVTVAKVNADFGQGRTLRAVDAMKAGLVDRIATYEEVLAELGSVASSATTRVTAAVPSGFNPESKIMNKKIKLELCKAGLCRPTDTDEAAEAALSLYCDAHGLDAKDEDKVLASFSPAAVVEPQKDTASVTTPVMNHGELLSTLRLSGLSADVQLELAQEWGAKLDTAKLPEVLDAINARKVEEAKTVGHDVSVKESAIDKFRTEARDAFVLQAAGGKVPSKIFDYSAGEYVDFKPARQSSVSMSSLKFAEQCLIMGGMSYQAVSGLAPMQIAKLVLGADPSQMGLRNFSASSDGGAFNTSGMFSNILLDAANVNLRRSYDDARTTYQIWMKRAPSVPDFKLTHAAIAGELGDPKSIPEDGEFEEVTMSDGKEAYRVSVWGSLFSISWQTIINDQLRSFNEAPAKMGRSMRRKENRIAYGVVNDNAALQTDNVALFHSSHTNRQTGANSDAAALKAKWAIAARRMAEQKGLDTDSGALNLEPRYIIYPPSLDDLVATALNSSSLHSSNPGVANTKQGAYEPIWDAQMGAAQGGSDTRYILAADYNDVDTIEYAYLQGLESPVIEQETSFTSLTIKRRMYMAFGVKAIDFRGLQDDTGE